MDLVSDDEDVVSTDASEANKEVVPGDEEEEGTTANDGLPEQTALPPSPPPSASAW